MKIRLLIILFINLSFGLGQELSLNTKLDELASAYNSIYGFSGTMRVVINDEHSFEKSYGLANRSFNIKNNHETRFSINSISKTFTTVAILMLAESNKLDLNTPIKEYLPFLNASWGDSITIHHLLSHTSGLPRESGVQAYHEFSFHEQVMLFEKQRLLFNPGKQYEYSNAGFILLGLIIETVSAQKYEAFVDQEVIQPLGLENTGYYSGRNVIDKLAVPYRLSPNGLEFTQRSKHYGANAGGGLYSNPADLYQFIKGLEEGSLLTKKYTDLLFYPHIKSGKKDAEAYAWSIKYFGDEKIYFAAGSGYGTKSVIIRMPDSGDFIGITSNWGNTPILQLLRDLYLTIRGQSISLPSRDELADPNEFIDHIGVYLFEKEALSMHLGLDRSTMTLQEFGGRLFLDDELLVSKGGLLKLSYTEELSISFDGEKMIVDINGNIIQGQKIEALKSFRN